MFEDRTYDNIVRETLARAPKGVDTRPGSIYFDAVAGACFMIAKYYADLATIFDLTFLVTAVGEYLDLKGQEFGVYRHQATGAVYGYEFIGTPPASGERFYTDGRYFTLKRDNDAPMLVAEEPGTGCNDVIEGTAAVPVNNIGGLISSAFGELIDPGVDTESDDDYRQRIRDKVAGPAENGNRQHYKTWCEQMPGVGRARIIPLWAGENTVKGVIISAEGVPATDAVVERVQEYIDPGCTGLGNGRANIGAKFKAIAAKELKINIGFKAELAAGATIEQAKEETTAAVTAYLRDLALNTPEIESMVVRITTIGAMLHNLPSMVDYTDLTLNGTEANIEIDSESVAVLGGVNIIEII